MFSSFKNFLFLSFIGSIAALALVFFIVTLIYPTLPEVNHLEQYRPKQPLQVFTKEGSLISEFGEERREYIPIKKVPQKMINAILAIEDRRFFEHPGIDMIGIARAALRNITGQSSEGASTITMQVARNFFLSSEKTLKRKINEILLAIKIEKNLTKEEILELYINQIYLGQRSFGFLAAANTYFDKNLEDINLAETTLLAGLPKAPSKYNPFRNPDDSIKRQHAVLKSMLRHGFIDKPTYLLALEEPINLRESFTKREVKADYVAEMVRQTLYEEFGEKIYTSGLKVYTTIQDKNQKYANHAVQNGLINYTSRHPINQPEAQFDLSNEKLKDEKNRKEYLIKKLRMLPTYGDFIPGVVIAMQPLKLTALLKNGEIINVYKKGLELLRDDLNIENPNLKIVKIGTVLRFVKNRGYWVATQLPEVESSLVSIDPQTGAILALVGGFDFYKSKYNHVTQAQRQPGSVFKPFIYSAALEKGINAASLVNDAYLYITAKELGANENWEPQNYNEKFSGPIRLRDGLALSKNLVAIRVLKNIGTNYAQDYIARFGFDPKKHPPYLSMALGVGQATPLEVASAYGVFANGGYLKKPYFIEKIIDSKGRKVKQSTALFNEETPRVIDPRNAFIMTDMLKEVINSGTAKKAKRLKRSDIAGKTGTTNDQYDAWFAGYNPDIVTITWVGFDQPKPLGKFETGSRAALPIWIDYMGPILNQYPIRFMVEPEGIMPVKIRKKDGVVALPEEEGIYEYFYEEFLPQSNAYYLIN